MLTKEQIDAAGALLDDGHLSETAQAQWLTLVRSLPEYRRNHSLFPNLTSKLAEAEGLTAKILQAALTQIELVGAGQESLGSPASAGVAWSRNANRTEFIYDGLNALYEAPAQRPRSAVVKTSDSWCYLHLGSCSVCGCSAGGRVLL